MTVITKELSFWTKGDTDIVDITTGVQGELDGIKCKNGIVTIFIPGSTGGLTTIEHEPGLESDFKKMIERLVPKNIEYAHDMRWHDGNGHSHIRSSIISPSLTVPFKDRQLLLGSWQQIILVDFDNRPRSRKVLLQIMGE
ncbi:MAG: secondary thiamine-phosphate synthase enzyme YjbQ [bacterium]